MTYVIPPAKMWLGRETLNRDVYDVALERVAHLYKIVDHVAVLFSGGKDSTCALHVTLEVATALNQLPLRVIFLDEECLSYETEEYARRVAQRPDVALEWYCLPFRHRNACSMESPFWWPWAPEAQDLWVRPLPAESIRKLDGFPVEPADARPSTVQTMPLYAPYSRHGNSALVMGVRAQESLTRLKAVSNKRMDNWLIAVQRGLWKAYPIYDWRTPDVWTAPARKGWDYNETYDIMEMAGVKPSSQRCAPPFGEEPRGLLWMWSQCFPDVWLRMCDRVPGAAAAARYSKTELYAYGHVTKSDDTSWTEHIRVVLAKHPPEVAASIAARIQQEIELHYRRTDSPILPYAPHPHSGISWEVLVKLAERGDMKGRLRANLHAKIGSPGSDQARRSWERYETELLREQSNDE